MAIDQGTDGSILPPQEPTRSGTMTAGGIEIPPFPAPINRSATRADAPVPSPLKADAAFRGPEAPARDSAAVEDAAVREDIRPPRTDTYTERAAGAGFALPASRSRVSTGRKIWFAIAFVLPVILGAAYIFFILPDQYVTEFRFSVRVPVGNAAALGSPGASTSALFGGNPTPGTDLLDNFTVADYVGSSQAAADLDGKVNLKNMYNKPGDPFSRVGSGASRERLARYWKSMIYSDYDVTTGLAVVRVKAYSAQDSYTIANTLLQLSNDLVNAIGTQSQQDTVHFAEHQVSRADQQVTAVRRAMAALSQHGGIDSPASGILPANVALATNTRTNVAQIKAQIDQLMNQLHNPDAPQIQALRRELATNETTLGHAVQAINALPTNEYADLQAELQTSLQVLNNANAALSNAKAASDSQRLYLTTYVKPNLPESPGAPDRWIDLLVVVVLSAMVWTIGLLFRNSILAHS